MKGLLQFIQEKLQINKDSKVKEFSDDLYSLLETFEFNNLYEIDKGRLQTKPYITKEEGLEIMEKLNKFLIENNANKDNFKYFAVRGSKCKNPRLDKKYNKNTSTIINLNSKLHGASDNEQIFKKNSLYFEVSSKEKLIGMYGPFGGSKVCQIE